MTRNLICLMFFSATCLGQAPNNPCAVSLQSTISTINSLISTVANSNRIADNVTDQLPDYSEKIENVIDSVNRLTAAINNLQNLANERISNEAVMGYMAVVALGSILVVTTGFFTFIVCQNIRNRFNGWKEQAS